MKALFGILLIAYAIWVLKEPNKKEENHE